MKGVILYGPPAAGKDTVTQALLALDNRFKMYHRLKVGPGKTSTYRMTDTAHIAALREQGEIVWENTRYGALYAIDKPGLSKVLHEGIPIIHVGQTEAITAIRTAFPDTDWLTVELWCDRETAARRLQSRNAIDVTERLRAWDETRRTPTADLRINTTEATQTEAASHAMKRLSTAIHSKK